VLPILREHCQGCHQPAKAKGELDLTTFSGLASGGGEGDTIVAGDPDASLLIELVTPFDGLPAEMPEDKPPLTPDTIEVLRRWIAEGAHDDTPPSKGPKFDAQHPPVYERPPLLTALAYSPDGALLAISGHHEVLLRSTQTGEITARLVGLSERIESLAFSPDGSLLAVAAGSPGLTGELQVWNVSKRQLRLSLPVTYDTIYGASWSHDGALVAFGCADNTARVVDAKSGEELLYQGAHSDWVLDTVFSTDSSHLVTVGRDRSMKLIKVATQQFIDNITSITPGALKGGLMAVDRHPERDELLIAGSDGAPKIFKMYRDKKRVIGDDYNLIRAFDALPGRIFDACYSPDGSSILAGSSLRGTGELRVYNAEDATQLWRWASPTGIYSVAYSPDGKTVAAGGFDGFLRLLDAADGSILSKSIPVPLTGDSAARALEAAASPQTGTVDGTSR
jgi:WD40 repeat protein